MSLPTFGVIVFLIWIAYLLIVPVGKISIPLVILFISVVMFCIGGWILTASFAFVISLFWLLTHI